MQECQEEQEWNTGYLLRCLLTQSGSILYITQLLLKAMVATPCVGRGERRTMAGKTGEKNIIVEGMTFVENLGGGSIYEANMPELKEMGITWWFFAPEIGNICDRSLLSSKCWGSELISMDFSTGKMSYWRGITKGMAEIQKEMTVEDVIKYMEEHVRKNYRR